MRQPDTPRHRRRPQMIRCETPVRSRAVGAAHTARHYLPEPSEAGHLLLAVKADATPGQRRIALVVLAENQDDLPWEITQPLLRYIARDVDEPIRLGEWVTLVDLVADIRGLRTVDGYADKFREEGEPPLDAEALAETLTGELRDTLHDLTERG